MPASSGDDGEDEIADIARIAHDGVVVLAVLVENRRLSAYDFHPDAGISGYVHKPPVQVARVTCSAGTRSSGVSCAAGCRDYLVNRGQEPVELVDPFQGGELDRLEVAPRSAPCKPRNGMTIAQAKEGLAQTFGVAPDAVVISIRG